MKNVYTLLIAVLAAAMLFLPLCAAKRGTEKSVAVVSPVTETENGVLRVRMSEDGEILKMELKEYLFCTVAAEMPAAYSTEALKAQTVAAYTYALFKSEKNAGEDYDITANSSIDQAFVTRDAAREKWGEDADTYEKKIDDVIDSVFGEALFYENAPAMTVYTAISPGKTETAENVWGKPYPYLVNVESIGDMLSPDYLTQTDISFEDCIAKLTPLGAGSDVSEYFKNTEYSDAGTLLKADFDGKTLTGREVRAALSLRSACFTVTAGDGVFSFSVRGYGHGVGMSQNGANYMAKQGSSYREILAWYYPGCELTAGNKH